MSSNPWVTRFMTMAPKADAKVILFCLGHAGGSAADFRQWDKNLSGAIRLVPIVLPGHMPRVKEPLIKDVSAVVEQLVPALVKEIDRPFAFFGQSFGTLVAFESAIRLTAMGKPPVAIVVSGRRAPQFPDPVPGEKKCSELPDSEMVSTISDRYHDSQMLQIMRTAPQMLEAFLGPLRGDMTAFDGYKLRPVVSPPPLSCPIMTAAGMQDDRVTDDNGMAWSAQTSAKCPPLRRYKGNHFYNRIDESVKAMLADAESFIIQSISAPAPVPAPAPAAGPAPTPAVTAAPTKKEEKPVAAAPAVPSQAPNSGQEDAFDASLMCF